jgi:hypothetical protein
VPRSPGQFPTFPTGSCSNSKPKAAQLTFHHSPIPPQTPGSDPSDLRATCLEGLTSSFADGEAKADAVSCLVVSKRQFLGPRCSVRRSMNALPGPYFRPASNPVPSAIEPHALRYSNFAGAAS